MAYVKTVWQNELGSDLNRFTKTEETGSSVKLTRNPGTITQAGTVFSVANMNNIENEIEGIANNTYTFGGNKTFSGLVTVSSSGITSSSSSIDLKKDTYVKTDGNSLTIGSGSFTDVYLTCRSSISGVQIGLNDNSLGGVSGFGLIKNGSSKGFGITVADDSLFEDVVEADLDYKITTTSRHIFGRGSTDNGTDLLQVGSDTDISASIGRGRLGYTSTIGSDVFVIGHYDQFNNLGYSLGCTNAGNTFINSTSLTTFKVNAADVATFSGSQIDLKKKTVIDAQDSLIKLSGAKYLQIGTGAFDTDVSYKISDPGNNTIRHETESSTLSHTWGYDSSGTFVKRMELTGLGRLVLNTTDDLSNRFQLGGSARIDNALTVGGEFTPEYNYKGSSVTQNTIFDKLKTWVTATDDYMPCSGSYRATSGTSNYEIIIAIERTSSTQIVLHLYNVFDKALTSRTIFDAGATVVPYIDIKSIHDKAVV